MSEAAPDLHVGPDPQQASVSSEAPAPEQPAAPAVDESAQAPSDAQPVGPAPESALVGQVPAPSSEMPPDASVVAENAPAVSTNTDGQQTSEATPSPSEAPDSPVSEASTEPPAGTPLTAAEWQSLLDTTQQAVNVQAARAEAVEKERDTIKEHYDRVYAEWNQLHGDLDAARKENADLKALPSLDHFRQQVESLQSRLEQEVAAHEQTKQERDLLAPAQPIATLESTAFSLPDADIARIKDAVLEALAEHAVPQVADAAPESEAPSSPFINRQ